MEREYEVLLTVEETVRRIQSALLPEHSISAAKVPNMIVGELAASSFHIRVQSGLSVRYLSYYLFGTVEPTEKGCRVRVWFGPHSLAIIVFTLWSIVMAATTIFTALLVLPSKVSLVFKAMFSAILVISALAGFTSIAHRRVRSRADLAVLLGFLESLLADSLIAQHDGDKG